MSSSRTCVPPLSSMSTAVVGNGHDPDLVTAYREHAAMCLQAADEIAGVSPLQADLFGGAR